MKNSFSPTLFMLMAAHNGGPTVRLDEVAELYFGLSPRTAQARATAGTLPVPAFRATQKSPYLIHLLDLAAYIDEQREQAAARVQHLSIPGGRP